MELIDKSALVEKINTKLQDPIACKKDPFFIKHGVVLWDKIDMHKEILSFLDAIEVKEVEEEPVSKDLEEELIKWHNNHFRKENTFVGMSGFYLTNNSQQSLAHHFAQWQKEQLMKNAVEAVIHPYDGEIWVDKDLLSIYDDCQRVKLIIIKEK